MASPRARKKLPGHEALVAKIATAIHEMGTIPGPANVEYVRRCHFIEAWLAALEIIAIPGNEHGLVVTRLREQVDLCPDPPTRRAIIALNDKLLQGS